MHDTNQSHSDSGRRGFMKQTVLAAAALGGSQALTAPRAASAGAAPSQAAHDNPAPQARPIPELLQGADPVTWIFTGDSITHGALHTLGWRSYPEHFAERVRWELRRMRDVVINTGISGERTGGLLKDFEWRALRFEPHVISIMIGMNDCSDGPDGRSKFRDNLQALVDATRAANATPLLHTPNTIYEKNATSRSDLPAYAEIVREIALASNVTLVDHWKHWRESKPNQEDLLPWLEDKSIHPGVFGHREFARETFRVLGIFDEASPTCMLEVP